MRTQNIIIVNMFKKGYKMSEEHKRKIGLANCFSISLLADEIHFEKSEGSGDSMIFRRGVEITSAEFDTLTAW